MATIQVCDICGSRENVRTVYYPTGHQSDGHQMEDINEVFDFCLMHRHAILKAAVRELIKGNIVDRVKFGRMTTKIAKDAIRDFSPKK